MPYGAHKGEDLSTIPASYLYFVARGEEGSLSLLAKIARQEIVRREALLGKPDPWKK